MTKIIKIALILALFLNIVNAATKLSKQETSKLEKLPLFSQISLKIDSAYDIGSIYLLNVIIGDRNDKIYLTKDKQYLIQGNVISTITGKEFSMPADLTSLKGKQAFTFGTGKDEYYMFTDPECPYCKKFEQHFPKIENKIKIHIFYFPLDFHKNARDLSLYVMSQKTYKNKVYTMLNTDKNTKAFKDRSYKKDELEKLEKHLDTQISLGKSLGVQGTPTVFDKNGNKVSWVGLLEKHGIKIK